MMILTLLISSSLVGLGVQLKILTDEDILRSPHDIILNRGFTYQDHHLTTDDGFRVTLWRIINPRISRPYKKYPVLFWHGFGLNGKIWLLTNPGRLGNDGIYRDVKKNLVNDCENNLTSNLPFTLSACGYDVWVGNNRATRWSWSHIEYSRYSREFWNFTLTDLAVYDIRNSIDYILTCTNTAKLTYVGYSQGTTMMFILLSVMPTIERKINLFLAFAPVCFIGNFNTITRILTPLVPPLNGLRFGFITPYYISTFMAIIFDLIPPLYYIANLVNQLDVGPNPTFIPPPSQFQIEDAACSKVILHFGQWVLSGRFAEFDYLNERKNMIAYGMKQSRDIPLENILSRNIVLIIGKTDNYVDTTDLNKLFARLRVKLWGRHIVAAKYFNHGDYLFNPNVSTLVNPFAYQYINAVNSR